MLSIGFASLTVNPPRNCVRQSSPQVGVTCLVWSQMRENERNKIILARWNLIEIPSALRWCYTGRFATPICNADSQRMFLARICRHVHLSHIFNRFRKLATRCSTENGAKNRPQRGVTLERFFAQTLYHYKSAFQIDQCKTTFRQFNSHVPFFFSSWQLGPCRSAIHVAATFLMRTARLPFLHPIYPNATYSPTHQTQSHTNTAAYNAGIIFRHTDGASNN